jgi:Condensation domain
MDGEDRTPLPRPLPRPLAAERIPVDFAGDGAGADEMSWGMWEIWNAMTSQNSSLHIGGRTALAPGTTVTDTAEELRYLMSRFPSMRTRLRFDASGRPTQEVFGTGSTALEVYDAGEADPDHLAEAVEQRYRETDFDYAGEWPVRMAVVRRHGLATHLVVIMDHLVTDAVGAMVMLREVRDRETAPVTGLQPLDQARWQRSPAGQRQDDRALRHWEGVLRSIPAGRHPGPADPRSPRHWGADFCSPAMRTALPVIADRTDTDTPTVLLTLFAVALHRITGINPVVVRPVVSNRFRPSLTDVVCQAAQAGVCVLDVADATVDQLVERARRGTMSAYKYAYFHPERLRELIARVCAERGEEVDVGCFFNDRGTHPRTRHDRTPTGAELARTLRGEQGDSTFRLTAPREDPVERFYLCADDAPDGLLMEIRVDTHFFPVADMERLARGMEAVAVEAALDPALDPVVAPARDSRVAGAVR